SHRPAARGSGGGPGHRRGPGHARLRHAGAVRTGHDHRRRGGPLPRRWPVPARQHGPQDRVGAALPGGRRGTGRGHLARPAGGDAGRRRAAVGHPHRAQPIPDRAGMAVPVSTRAGRVFPGSYRDSLLLLSATRAMEDSAGVSWASAAMATPATVDDLTGRGFPPGDLAGADANALVLAVCAADADAADEALSRGRAALFAQLAQPGEERRRPEPRTISDAAARLPQANVAVISVPGPYAAMAAHAALTAGLHVLLFSYTLSLPPAAE